MPEPTKCRACGCPIVFAKNPATGKLVPMDVRAHVYELVEICGELELKPTRTGQLDPVRFAVSHYATCPQADQFRKPKDQTERA